jgi:hypothetical protein
LRDILRAVWFNTVAGKFTYRVYVSGMYGEENILQPVFGKRAGGLCGGSAGRNRIARSHPTCDVDQRSGLERTTESASP